MVPLSEILAFAQYAELIGSVDEFIYVLQRLDRRYVKHFKEKQNGRPDQD